MTEDAMRLANRSIRYVNAQAADATAGLMEMFAPQPKRSVGDWLEHTDYGYGLGLLAAIGGGCCWIAAGYIAATPLIILGALLMVAAFTLCWWFA